MRYLEGGVVGIVTAGVLSVTIILNYEFGASFGHSVLQARLFGGAAILVDLLKALLPLLMWGAWRERRLVASAVGTIMWIGCLLISLVSALGVLASSRSTEAGVQAAEHRANQSIVDDLKRKEARRADIGAVEAVAVHEGYLAEARTEYSWSATKSCTVVDGRERRAYCAKVRAIETKRDIAQEAAALDAALAALRMQAATAAARGADRGSAAQSAILARVLATPRQLVEDGLSLFWVGVIELIACFGFFLARQHMAAPSHEKTENASVDVALIVPATESVSKKKPQTQVTATNASRRNQVALSAPVVMVDDVRSPGRVSEFCVDVLAPGTNGKISFDTGVAAYLEWCSRKGKGPLAPEDIIAGIQDFFHRLDDPRVVVQSWGISGARIVTSDPNTA